MTILSATTDHLLAEFRVGDSHVQISDELGEPEIYAWVDDSDAIMTTSPTVARDAAAVLRQAATKLEELQAAKAGLRVFDCPFDRHTYEYDGPWWVGEQTDHGRAGEVRLFAIPAEGEHAPTRPTRIGTKWGKPIEDGMPSFTHVIVAKARWISEVKIGKVTYERYVEVTD